ncbi:MAG: chromosome segregation protein SMC [Capsulimonadales bacterium]|nr:chromosome segregation protein SMC [Capsulimonadales bacterium]
MRLKRLTLHGFKTFADKTDIEFSDGVTVIVGPNGSGKSNVVDSLLWCLGEQKASSLRASKAQDVIFAGSSRRKPMGMAEVSLTVDNEDRFLPLDFSEVTVTRRIYRSGDSEYLLNKVPCRLKDITELFLDTGVGRGAYAIVNQSEIDAILSARPEDRRELFEEAAGIKKYRVRKREAHRKLENTEQNLIRIRDIAREVESQLEPLAAQAATARRYHELTDRLREIEVGLLAADYARYRDEWDELAAMAGNADREAESLRAEASALENSVGLLGKRITEAEAEMDSARLLQQTALAEGERIAGRIALSTERRAAALRAAESLERDLAGLAQERTDRETEAERLRAETKTFEDDLTHRNRELAAAEEEARETERALNDLTRTVAGQEADFLQMAKRLAAQRAEWEAVKTRIAAREREIAETETRRRERQRERETGREMTEALTAAVAEADAALTEAQRVLNEEREPARLRAVERTNALAEQRTTQERRLAELRARLRALEEMEAAQEGYFAGVRSVVRAVQEQHLTGRYQVVADAIRVPAELDTAIEVALGASLQDIITDTETEARAAIRFLNERRGGRATFLPLDALRDPEIPDTLIQAARQYAGVRGSAALLVGHEAEVTAAVRVLLARVLIVDDLETALSVSKRLRRDWARIVTLNGEVVVPTGAITGGSQARQTANLLGRKREIGELTAASEEGEARREQLREREAVARRQAEEAQAEVVRARTAAERARETRTQAERRRELAHLDLVRLERETESLTQRIVALRDAGTSDTARETALAAAVSGSESIDESAQATREEMQRRRAVLTVRRDEAQRKTRTLGAEVASLRERIHARTREADRNRDAALRASVRMEERRTQAEEAQRTAAREEEAAPELRAAEQRVRQALNDSTGRFEKWRDRRQSLLNENFQLTERIKAAERGASRATEQAQSARVRAARIEVQRDAIVQRLLEEYELHPDSALALTEGQLPDKSVTQEIGRLRREIKALGNVNTGAVEEYDRLSERATFLREQQTDLEQARATLLAAIAEIDETTRGVFMETFQAVGAAFFRLFARLFGGGAAELVLTDPEDIFETGIEILAQPPGKKRQNLSLLSGGERALTATALLFAFLEVRPAPFCVLDEVDAPLDGANVEKFTDLLRDFGKTSQFIVITHNPTTMEAAPLWYGVTMQEPGVSRGLSMRAPEPPTGSPSD